MNEIRPPGRQMSESWVNSRLLDFYLQKISTPFRGGFYAYNRQYIEQLPIRLIDFSNPTEKKLHDDLVALVDVMLALHQRKSPHPPFTKGGVGGIS